MPANLPRNSSKEDQIKQGYGLSKISRLPRDYGRFELGSHGWAINWPSAALCAITAKVHGRRLRKNLLTVQPVPTPTLHTKWAEGRSKKQKASTDSRWFFDFYANYEPKKNLILRFDIQNAFNKRYIDPLDAAMMPQLSAISAYLKEKAV